MVTKKHSEVVCWLELEVDQEVCPTTTFVLLYFTFILFNFLNNFAYKMYGNLKTPSARASVVQ